MRSTLYQLSQDFLHLFFPHHCCGCGSDLIDHQQLVCPKCLVALPYTGFFNVSGNAAEKSFYGRLPIQAAGACFFFRKHSVMQQLITQLKYRHNQEVGTWLGDLTGEAILSSTRFHDIDAIVPIPLSDNRLQQRGYNQAEVIAKAIGKKCGWPVLPNAICRIRNTKTQTGKDRLHRWQDIQEVFDLADAAQCVDKHLLIVDDVLTTGATIEAAARPLLAIPGVRLSVATVAWTI